MINIMILSNTTKTYFRKKMKKDQSIKAITVRLTPKFAKALALCVINRQM
jgi:hypothetical protein